MNHPLLLSPLAKTHYQGKHGDTFKGEGSKYLTERFEMFINGREYVNAYSE